MSYIRSSNPAGKTPGRGWAPNLRGRGLGSYIQSANPSGKTPGVGWAPNLRGLGCGCKKKSLGQDVDDDFYAGQPQNQLSFPGTTSIPPGYGYGPSQSGGVTTYPVGPITADPSPLSTGFTSVLNNPSVSPLSGGLFSTSASSAAFGGISTTEWIVGGLGVLALVMVVSGKRR